MGFQSTILICSQRPLFELLGVNSGFGRLPYILLRQLQGLVNVICILFACRNVHVTFACFTPQSILPLYLIAYRLYPVNMMRLNDDLINKMSKTFRFVFVIVLLIYVYNTAFIIYRLYICLMEEIDIRIQMILRYFI